ETAQRRWSTIEEPPAIRSFQRTHRDRSRNRTVKGSFAPLARLHSRIESEFTYDPAIARFTPKNPLGAAGETLDAVHAAKEKAEKSGIYEKMASGDPNDIFDAADNPKTWDTLLRRPFHTLKADGPFIFERADVDAEVADQLASLGDPPTTFRLGRPLRPLGSDLVIRPLGSDLSSPGVRPREARQFFCGTAVPA